MGPPTEGCRQRVSACVLARVNAVGASVRLSMRGDGLRLAKQVGVDTMFRENHGTDIASFKACSTTSTELKRNCDWAPRHVGRCVPGDVTIRASGRIRVCAGVYGCDDTSAPDITQLVDATNATVPSPPRYGGAMLATGESSVTIQCPGNGPLLDKQTGYFAVMVDAATQPEVAVTQAQDPLAEYPASEAAAFTYREGAFYGDLFEDRAVEASPYGILWNDQYACYSNVWSLSQALLADRLCANATPKGKCFGTNTPGPCEDRCTSLAGSPRVEDACHPRPLTPLAPKAGKAFEPYTVYLNHPCDLASDYARCVMLSQHATPQHN
jgi:hypothetical protein